MRISSRQAATSAYPRTAAMSRSASTGWYHREEETRGAGKRPRAQLPPALSRTRHVGKFGVGVDLVAVHHHLEIG